MKIGLFLEKTLTFTHTPGIYGDELWANALCKGLNKIEDIESTVYGENLGFMPEVDIAVYFYFFKGKPKGKKNIFIFQNFTDQDNHMFNMQQRLEWVKNKKFDKVFTISKQYSEKYGWALLYPCVDMELFTPQPENKEFAFDLAYIGNNIKDLEKTKKWLNIPNIKYGIFGNGFNKPINHRNSLKVFSNSINLNFGFDVTKEILTARIFQISACKGIIICEYLEAYRDIFGDTINWVYEDPMKEIPEILLKLKQNKEKVTGYQIVKEMFNCEIQAKTLWRLINDKIN